MDNAFAIYANRTPKNKKTYLYAIASNGTLARITSCFGSKISEHEAASERGKIVYSKGNDHLIDVVRRALLIREEQCHDKGADEVVSLKPVLTDPVFI